MEACSLDAPIRLIFDGFHRFYVILGGSVCISWIPGARGQPGGLEAWRLAAWMLLGLIFDGFH